MPGMDIIKGIGRKIYLFNVELWSSSRTRGSLIRPLADPQRTNNELPTDPNGPTMDLTWMLKGPLMIA